MAQKVNIILTDDLDPSKTADETVTFTLDGSNYEIDLTSKNADKFRGLFQDYIAAGRKVMGSRGRKSGSRSKGGGVSAADVRFWGSVNGVHDAGRGRVGTDLKAAYNEAHPESPYN